MSWQETLGSFKAYAEKIYALTAAQNMFFWDVQTGAPPGAVPFIGKQVGILAAEAFAMSISPEMKGFLEALAPYAEALDDADKAFYRICKKNYTLGKSIPVSEMRAYTELTTLAETLWEQARAENNYPLFAPYLEKIIQFNLKFAGYRASCWDSPPAHPYDTALDLYEPDMTVAALDAFFDRVKARVTPLLQAITAQQRPRPAFLSKAVPRAKQEALSGLLMDVMGFDRNRGMLRESAHPFTLALGKDNVRMTTRYHQDAFLSNVFSVLHEGGHALYEQNKDDALKYTILDDGISMGIHESQSRFMENIVGRSPEFWAALWPEFTALVGDCLGPVTPEEFSFGVNAVTPSLIRIEADELTYPRHILIRYEIEKQLFTGAYDIAALPALWNAKYAEYLGVEPPDDASGILQDVHWSGGMLGYFPSYALGNAYAAQFLAAMAKDLDVPGLLRAGQLCQVTGWLRDKIHRHGSVYTPGVLTRAVTGEGFNPNFYTEYLEKKFRAVYGL
jgi:carboxypeptidase Taq